MRMIAKCDSACCDKKVVFNSFTSCKYLKNYEKLLTILGWSITPLGDYCLNHKHI
mgnify:CR=1 FL=1